MNEKRFWLGLIGGGTLLAIGAGSLIYLEYQNIDELHESVDLLNNEISGARSLLQGTPELERDVIVLRETDAAIKEILPDEQDVNNLVRTLSKFEEDSEVQISGLKKKAPERRARGEVADFDKVAYQITLQADAFNLLSFMDRLEGHARFMRIPSVRLSSAPRRQVEEKGFAEHKIQMDVETYVYQPQNGPEPVKIDGYERKRELLLGEIARRRQALITDAYVYRGQRGRRDPWVDPRVPVEGPEDGLPVEEQMQIVEGLVQRTNTVLALWEQVQKAENVIVEITQRAELEKKLTALEEEIRRIDGEALISFVPSVTRLDREVIIPSASLRTALADSEGGRGPSKDTLEELIATMVSHMDVGEYDLALQAYQTIEPRLVIAEADPLRLPFVENVRELATQAQTASDFEKIQMEIKGIVIADGQNPIALINGKTLTEGDLLGEELVIRSIRPGAIEFIFRGIILERRF